MLRERIYSKYIQMKICILQNLRLTTTKCAHILITLVFCRIIYRTIFIVVRWCGEQYQRRLMVLGTLTKRMVQVSLCLCLWCGAIDVYSVFVASFRMNSFVSSTYKSSEICMKAGEVVLKDNAYQRACNAWWWSAKIPDRDTHTLDESSREH